MTVALMAQRHRRSRYLWMLAVALVSLVVLGGLAMARGVQLGIAGDAARVLGVTDESIQIFVDGRDVTLVSDGPITAVQREAVAAVPNVGNLTVEGE